LLDHQIQFASGVFYEDHPFAIHLMLTARTVYLDAPVSYAYFQRATSTTKVNDKKSLDFIEIRKQCLALFEKFGVSQKLAPVVVGYIAPVNFYQAHVSEPFQQEFISRLHADFTAADYAFLDQYGDNVAQVFAGAVKANDPNVLKNYFTSQAPRRRYNREGARRLVQRVKQKALQTAASSVHRVRAALFQRGQHDGVDTTGRRFMTTGPGTRIEPIMIDVRVKQENRPYVKVGEQSHVGGTFVFERGLGTITIGDRSSIGGGCKFICSQENGISIGNNVMLSWDCTLMDSNAHSLDPDIRANDAYDWKCGVESGRIGAFKDWSQVDSAPIVIEDKAWLGFEVAVMKGVTIGEGAVVGSRSLVAKDVAAFCVYAGTPAKFVSLVPREQWPYHDLVRALQGDPSYDQLLRDAYMHRDVLDCFERFRASDEFRETLAKIRSMHPQARRLLDVGGGSGFAAIAFAAEGFHVTLVEPSNDKVVGVGGAELILDALTRKESERFPGIRDRIQLICADAETFDFAQRQYDVVYLRQVVHHLPNAAVSVARFANTLAPSGLVMFIREHVVFDAQDKQLFLEHHPLHAFTQGENAYTELEYQQIIKSANLNLLETLRFADSVINYFPHSYETAQTVGEIPVYGRPYSFIARKDA
jgi:acetyltransferase-like isoleucine patch superfamily enzyme/SAM-dependent methyltransferase